MKSSGKSHLFSFLFAAALIAPMPFLWVQPVAAMAGKPTVKSDVQTAQAMRRYIVTHNCKKGDEQKIVKASGARGYRIVQVFEFTPQFIIEATDSAAQKLGRSKCVVGIQPDGVDAPSGLLKPSG